MRLEEGKEVLFFFVDQGNMEGILRDIDATKKIKHGHTSHDVILSGARVASFE